DVLQRLFPGQQQYARTSEFQKALRATSGRPQDVSRSRRIAGVAALSVCVLPGLLVMFSITWGIEIVGFFLLAHHANAARIALERLHEGMSREITAASAQPNPVARALALRQLDRDFELEERLQATVQRSRLELQAREAWIHPIWRTALPLSASGIG